MTFIVNLFRSGWIYLTLFLVIALELYWLAIGHPARLFYILFLEFTMAALLGWLYLRHKNIVSGYALPIYGLLFLHLFAYFNMSVPMSETAINMALPFFPMIIIYYLLNVRKKYIPGSGALYLMLFGFLVSVMYQITVHRGQYVYSMENDISFFLNILVFFILYMLLALGILSVRHMVLALSFSVFPFLVFVIYGYIRYDAFNLLFTTRFGHYMDYSPNHIAVWLDLAFPPMLFFAINEKKRALKLLFSFMAIFYCIVLFLTSSRGSFPGLFFILLFLLIRSKSVKLWITVLAFSLVIAGFFGGPVMQRFFKPSRADVFSNMGRVELLKSAYPLFKSNHFFFGIGMDNFRTEKFKFGFPVGFDPGKFMSSHDIFLELLSGWGLMGLMGGLYFIFGSMIRLVRAKLPPDINYLRLSLAFSALSFSLHAFSESAIAYFVFQMYLFSWFACISFLIRVSTLTPGSYRVSHSNIVIFKKPLNYKEYMPNV